LQLATTIIPHRTWRDSREGEGRTSFFPFFLASSSFPSFAEFPAALPPADRRAEEGPRPPLLEKYRPPLFRRSVHRSTESPPSRTPDSRVASFQRRREGGGRCSFTLAASPSVILPGTSLLLVHPFESLVRLAGTKDGSGSRRLLTDQSPLVAVIAASPRKRPPRRRRDGRMRRGGAGGNAEGKSPAGARNRPRRI